MPIQISRPTTFISVNPQTAESGAPGIPGTWRATSLYAWAAASPAASAEFRGTRVPGPVRRRCQACKHAKPAGRISAMAHDNHGDGDGRVLLFSSHCTGAMATGAADPAHRASRSQNGAQPAARKRAFCSTNNIPKMSLRKRSGALNDRHRPCPDDQSEGQCRPEQHDTGLDVIFNPKAGIHPARQSNQVGYHHAR